MYKIKLHECNWENKDDSLNYGKLKLLKITYLKRNSRKIQATLSRYHFVEKRSMIIGNWLTCNSMPPNYSYVHVYLSWFRGSTLTHPVLTLHWRHNGLDSVSDHQPHDYLLNRLFRCRSKKISKLCVTGLCAGNSPETGEFPAQMASNAENVSIWWRHHEQLCNVWFLIMTDAV